MPRNEPHGRGRSAAPEADRSKRPQLKRDKGYGRRLIAGFLSAVEPSQRDEIWWRPAMWCSGSRRRNPQVIAASARFGAAHGADGRSAAARPESRVPWNGRRSAYRNASSKVAYTTKRDTTRDLSAIPAGAKDYMCSAPPGQPVRTPITSFPRDCDSPLTTPPRDDRSLGSDSRAYRGAPAASRTHHLSKVATGR